MDIRQYQGFWKMSNENYRSVTKSHDPGWNDPPKLAFNVGLNTKPSPKLNLRQRVAFPVAGTDSSRDSNDGPAHSVPQFVLPPVSTTNTLPVSSAESSSNIEPTAGPSNEELREFVTATLDKFALKLNSSRQADVRKRLEIMQQSWDEAKLGEELCRKLYQFAEALESGDVLQTNVAYRAVVVDHGSECSQWISALRHLMLPAIQTLEMTELRCDTGSITKPIL